MRVAVDPTQRVELNGVSVLPPAGQTWYAGPRDRHHVMFGRVPPEPPHTIVAMALVDRIQFGGPVLGAVLNAQDLKEVTERRWQSGGRYTTIQSSVHLDTSRGVECVRVDVVTEERNHPQHPGVVLVQATHTLDCLHPQNTEYLVSVGYSERHPQGQPPFSAETVQAEGESFIRSTTFTPVR
jgi:hypothetical protein